MWLHRITVYSSAFALALVLTGCVSTGSNNHVADGQNEYQFDPLPVPEISTQDLQPGAVNATQLLADAQTAFDRANKAQKDGDKQTAYAQYNAMMELLLESDLDPAVFYDLRKEFSKILQETTKYARLYEATPRRVPAKEVGQLATRSQLEYPDPINDRILAEIRYIQSSYPVGFQAGLDRSAKYLPYIREEFRKAGLPQDLVWLAMVESQFTPRINSRVGAGGMWQFMPSTGRRYGLERDHYIDQRYDWKKATHAAIQYLSELYEMFDESWPLAVSAYNMGEGGVERVIARNGGQRDLWLLLETPPASTRIPRETKKFYAKLLASAIIANNPERYGFTLSPDALVETTVIQVTGAYTISDIEKAGGLPTGTLQKLNTQFLYGYTPPNRTTELYVPVDKLARVQSSLVNLPKLRPDTHVVRRGETLSGIASMYQVSSRDMMRINNISSPRRLQINQRLVIPGRMGSSDAVMATNAPGRKVYSVRKGDSLSKIATRNGISVSNLQRWNLMGDQTRIHIGDRLYVSKPVIVTASAPKSNTSKPTPNASPTGTPSSYTVKSGDYLDKIAKSHGVTLESLLEWNNLTLRSTIRVGDKLKLYNAYESVPAESATGSTRTHTVKRGQNPGVIAKQYGVRVSDLLRWNGLTKSTIVHIGDVLYVQSPSAPKAAPKEIIHTVKRGENPGAIARKYKIALNDLYTWNGLPKNPVIRVGQKLKIKQ